MSTDTKKPKSYYITTPVGVFSYVYVDKPDNFKGAEKYKATILFQKGDAEVTWAVGKVQKKGTIAEFVKAITDIHREFGGKAKVKNPIKDGDTITVEDKTTGEEKPDERVAGQFFIGARSKFKPTKLDGRGNEAPGLLIFSGDVGRLVIKLGQYEDGASATLVSAKLIEKRHTGQNKGDAFGDEGGYEATEDDAKPRQIPKKDAESVDDKDEGDDADF